MICGYHKAEFGILSLYQPIRALSLDISFSEGELRDALQSIIFENL